MTVERGPSVMNSETGTQTTFPSGRLSDDELMTSINQGQHVEESLSIIQRRYGRQVRQFIGSIVRDEWLAQDVAQETFVKVFLKSNLYQIGTNFRAWVFEVARNQSLSALRSKRRIPRPVTSLNFMESEDGLNILDQILANTNNRALEESEFMQAFENAVANLKDHYQSVFRRCVIHGDSYQDVASDLNIPTGTVAIRIMRARKQLYQALSPHLDRLRRPPACVQ
jgi:RNA polymerase sigma-70 factor (ECF subfamily)